MATLDSAVQQIISGCGVDPPRPLTYGKIMRFGRPKKKYWYVLREYRARDHRYFVAGSYGWFEGDQKFSFTIEHDFTGMDADERERVERSMKAQRELQAQKQQRRAQEAGQRAKAQWQAADKSPVGEGDHAYLVRKGVTPENVRFDEHGAMLVPMLDLSEEKPRINGLQKIAPDGEKRFTTNMDKKGTMCPLGRPAEGDRIIGMCEGYATGRSVRMAIGESMPVYVGFDAGGLLPGAQILRKRYPDAHLLFLADDDVYLNARINKRLANEFGVEFGETQALYVVGEGPRLFKGRAGDVVMVADWVRDGDGVDGVIGSATFEGRVHSFAYSNAGMTRAREAARAVGNASVIAPVFKAREVGITPDAAKLTDFNDLHAVEGLDAVKLQVEAAILAGMAPPAAKAAAAAVGGASSEAEPPKKAKGKKSRPASPAAGGGGGGDDDDEEPPDYRLFEDFFRKRFTYIYPTEMAFDHDLAILAKVGNLKLAYTTPVVNWWLAWRGRATVNKDAVVFDPIGAEDPKTTVNLFRGLETKPNPRKSCERLLHLIHYLCGEDPEDTQTPLTDWVLKWAAYPLQHVGAKMRTAIVMYGEEGTGKNIFWGALRDIYGRYGGIIGQNQLNSQFNTWLSAKLFLIANEVVTAQERSYYVGYLKNLITEPEVLVEPKGVDARQEANHCNLVFLSNELQPLKLGPRDRRYMVIKTPLEKDKAYYDALGEELKNGGAAALMHYLQHLPLGDFNEHTKPIFTDAKGDLIELSMSSTQLFWKDLHDGLLPMPYSTCFLNDAFEAYQIWSARTGERMPAKLAQFSSQFMTMNGVTRTKPLRIIDPDEPREKVMGRSQVGQRKLFLMGEKPPPEVDVTEWLDQQCAAWRIALKQYRSRGRHGGRQEEDQDEPF